MLWVLCVFNLTHEMIDLLHTPLRPGKHEDPRPYWSRQLRHATFDVLAYPQLSLRTLFI